MDEMWQRHKSFIVQIFLGGLVFLIAFFTMRNIYGGEGGPERIRRKNADAKEALTKQLDEKRAPDLESINRQKEIADAAERQEKDQARRSASLVEGNAYVKESIQSTLTTIGRANEINKYMNFYAQAPQVCLSSLREAVRGALVGLAAQKGKTIDEGLGVSGAFEADEIPGALQGLSILAYVANTCLGKPGIDAITELRISPTSSFPESLDVSFVAAVSVHMAIEGDPSDVIDVLRSMNPVGQPDRKMIVLEQLEYLSPVSTEKEDDTVKTAVQLAGLRLKTGAKE